jgi:hypothetical protein
MVEHLTTLETFQDLESVIIKETKVAKLLKVILKNDIPRDEEYKFKDRCQKLLNGWNKILTADDVKTADPKDDVVLPSSTNGVTKEEKTDTPAAINGDNPASEPKKEDESTAAAEKVELAEEVAA